MKIMSNHDQNFNKKLIYTKKFNVLDFSFKIDLSGL